MRDRSSVSLLNNAESYGEYFYESLTDTAVQTFDNNVTYSGNNVGKCRVSINFC